MEQTPVEQNLAPLSVPLAQAAPLKLKLLASNLTALEAAIELLADAILDTVDALEPGKSAIAIIWGYKNLVEDIMELAPQIHLIPKQLDELSAEDGLGLVRTLVTKLKITDIKATEIINASLKLLNDLVLVIVPDVEVLVAAIKAPPVGVLTHGTP